MANTTIEDWVFNLRVDDAGNVTGTVKAINKELDQSEEKAKKAAKGFDIFDKKIIRLIGSLLGFKAIMGRVLSFAAQGEQLAFLAQEADISAGKIQTLGKALKDYGGDNTTAANTLKTLNQQVRDMRRGMGGQLTEASFRFGLDMRGVKDGEQALFRIAQRMEGLSTQRQLELGRALGLDPATMRLVQGGVANLNKELERASKFNVFTPQDIERSQKFQRSLRDFKDGLNAVWAVVARLIVPVFTIVAEKISDLFLFLTQHKPFVVAFFAIILALLAKMALASIIAFAPFWLFVGLIALIITLIALLIDEVWTFVSGGESLIGDFIEWLKGRWAAFKEWFAGLWQNIKDGWAEAVDWFKGLWDGIINGAQSLCEKLKTGFGAAIGFILNPFQALYNFIVKVIEKIKEAIDWAKDSMLGKAVGFVSDIGGGIKDFFTGGSKEVPDVGPLLNAGQAAVANVGAASPLVSGAMTNSSQSKVVNNNIKTEVVVKGDATEEVAGQVGTAVSDAYVDIAAYESGGG